MGQKWLKDEDKTVQEVLKDRVGHVGPDEVGHFSYVLPNVQCICDQMQAESSIAKCCESAPWVARTLHACLRVPCVTKEKIAKLGENIVIRRFSRLTLGEARGGDGTTKL